ncbi:hypothetical protein D3C86_1838590 [compost metagenome]
MALMQDAKIRTGDVQRRCALFREHVTRHAAGQRCEIDRQPRPLTGAQRDRFRIGFWPGGGIRFPFRPAM